MKNRKDSRQKSQPKTGLRVSFAHVLLVLSGMVLMVGGQFVYRSLRSGHDIPQAQDSAKGQAAASNSFRWGALEFTPLALDRPAEYFTNEVRAERAEWYFRNSSAADVKTYFASLELDKDARAFLQNEANYQTTGQAIRVVPPPQLVINLSPATRQKLYGTLGQWPENAAQRTPFLFRPDGFNEWFGGCGLPADKLETIRKMTFMRG